MSDQRSGSAKVVGTAPVRRGQVLDVMMELRGRRQPGCPDPDVLVVQSGAGEVLLRFDSGPEPVVAWSQALGFGSATNRVDDQLRQAIIESMGTILGWRIVVQHIHTEPVPRLGSLAGRAA